MIKAINNQKNEMIFLLNHELNIYLKKFYGFELKYNLITISWIELEQHYLNNRIDFESSSEYYLNNFIIPLKFSLEVALYLKPAQNIFLDCVTNIILRGYSDKVANYFEYDHSKKIITLTDNFKPTDGIRTQSHFHKISTGLETMFYSNNFYYRLEKWIHKLQIYEKNIYDQKLKDFLFNEKVQFIIDFDSFRLQAQKSPPYRWKNLEDFINLSVIEPIKYLSNQKKYKRLLGQITIVELKCNTGPEFQYLNGHLIIDQLPNSFGNNSILERSGLLYNALIKQS